MVSLAHLLLLQKKRTFKFLLCTELFMSFGNIDMNETHSGMIIYTNNKKILFKLY